MAGDHKCPVCNATFTRPQHVARHMRSHTGDRPYKCQHCGDQFARSDLLSRHVNKCHAAEKPPTTTAPNRRKGSASASRATTSKQACDQCVVTNLPCDGSNPCTKCISRKCRCTYVKFHRQTAPVGPGHPAPSAGGEKNLQHPQFAMDSILPSEEYLLSNPQHAAVNISGLNGAYSNRMPSADFTFPGGMYSRSASLPVANPNIHGHQSSSQSPPEHGSPDFATQYRAQADLMSRAGILPNGGISISGSNGIGSNTVQPSQQQQQQQLFNGNTDQRYGLSSASWGSSRQSNDHMEDVMYQQNNRPQSQSGYPGSLPSSFSSTNSDLYDFRYNNRDVIDDYSDSEHGHSEHGHSSSDHSYYDSPSIPQHDPAHLMSHEQQQKIAANDPQRQQHHEGFSSAFGLMSLDDPNVLAGIAADGTPFFTHLNHNGEPGPSIPLPKHVRDDMMLGMNTRNKLNEQQNEMNGGITANGMTPREVELRELKDFWKQYMSTPLTAPHQSGSSNGFPLATPTPNNLHGHGQLEVRSSPSRKLNRVASLPSVKTPPLLSDMGPLGHPGNSHNQYHAFVSNANDSMGGRAPPRAATTYMHSQLGPDDLKSYEQAVLARKAPTLSLQPRKRPGTSGGVERASTLGGGRFSNPSTTTNSPIVPQGSVVGIARSSSVASRASSADSGSSDGSGGATASARPTFKRLPSTTLGPSVKKRTLLSVAGDEWNSGGMLGGEITAEPNANAAMLNMQMNAIAQQDRHRRMSEPVAAHGLK